MAKVLIFTASIGSGHITASRGIYDRCTKEGKDAEIIDILEWTYIGRFCRKMFSLLGQYTPSLLSFIFYSASKKTPSPLVEVFHRMLISTRKVNTYFENSDIEQVWNTFSAFSIWIEQYWTKEIHVQITDYSTPHLSWGWGKNTIVYALDIESQQYLHSVFPDKKIIVRPFPLPQKILEISSYSSPKKNEIRKKNNLAVDKKYFLFFFHHIILGNEHTLIQNFLENPLYSEWNSIIFAGNNYHHFVKFQNNTRVRVLGWEPNIHEYYAIASAVCGKCGGAFVSECVYLDLPICIAGVFGGQERGNKKFLEKYYAHKIVVL